MTTTDALLIALIVIVAAMAIQAEIHHRQLMHLLTDLATMIGEFWDYLEK